jgi:hypothetical protein
MFNVGSLAVPTVKAQVYADTPGATNIEVKNNLWVNSYFNTGHKATAKSNNDYYGNVGGGVPVGETSQVTETENPFVNSATYNFQLKATANAVGRGLPLSNVFTFDLLSKTRGSTWDIGAYQYKTVTSLAPPADLRVIEIGR